MVSQKQNRNKFKYQASIITPYDKFIIESKIENNLKSYERAEVKVSKTGNLLQISILAADISALRASFNSITRDLSVVEGTKKVLQHKSSKIM